MNVLIQLVWAVVKGIDRFTLWIGLSVRWLVALITALMGYEVVMRYVFASPQGWSYDSTVMIGAVYFLYSASYTLLVNGHIRVDLLYHRYGLRRQKLIDVVGAALFMFPPLVALLHRGWYFAWRAIEVGEESHWSFYHLPMAPLRFAILIGFVILMLQLVSWFIRQCHTLITGSEVVPEAVRTSRSEA